MLGTKEQIIEWLQDKKEDAIFEITQKRTKSIRSLAQNKYYFGVLLDILCDFHGENPIAMHELVKKMVGLETTTDLSTTDFKFMCDMLIELYREKFGVHIPKPNEVEELKSLEKYFY